MSGTELPPTIGSSLCNVANSVREACRAVVAAYRAPMLDWAKCSAVERVPGRVSGAWVFKGTRVPVRALFENLEGGATVEDFLEWFPGVKRDQVLAVLQHTESTLAETVP